MIFSAWYGLLQAFTPTTIFIDANLPIEKRNEKIEDALKQLGKVSVRTDGVNVNPIPCTTLSEVWTALKAALRAGPTQYLCLRQWVGYDELFGVRCFVNEGITSITQIDFQETKKLLKEFTLFEPEEVKFAILMFVWQFLLKLPRRCTIDLAFTRKLEFLVVDVDSTPIGYRAAGLFDLNKSEDLWRVERGQQNIRFRYALNHSYALEEC